MTLKSKFHASTLSSHGVNFFQLYFQLYNFNIILSKICSSRFLSHHCSKLLMFNLMSSFYFTIRENNHITVQLFEWNPFEVISSQKIRKFQIFNSTANLFIWTASPNTVAYKSMSRDLFLLTLLCICLFLVGCILCMDAFLFVFLMFVGF